MPHTAQTALAITLICASATPASAQRVDTAKVRALVRAGNAAWDRQDFKGSIVSWADAYALTSEPELLYRIGQAHERLGNPQRAREYTEAYLKAVPDSPYAEAIRARIAALAQQERSQQPRLTISSKPAGAIIHIDGMEETARTPATVPASAGSVSVALTHPGYPGVTLRADVITAPGATVSHSASFTGEPAKPAPKPKQEPKQEPKPTPRPETTPLPEAEPEPALTIVDIRPPAGIYIIGWTGLIVGSLATTLGMLIDYNDIGNEYTMFWVGGLALSGLSGYLMFGYDWADDLPRVSANPQHTLPTARTINLSFEW
jgi:hypothetical protein